MSLKVYWTKCHGNNWANLYAVDLHHPHFNNLDGVYVVWHGGSKPEPLRVGAGPIRDSIKACRNDPAIRKFKDFEIYATWAPLDEGLSASAANYLAKKLSPKAQGPVPESPPVEINLPNESATGGLRQPPGELPTQTWQDLASSGGEIKLAAKAPEPKPAEPKAQQRVVTDIIDILTQCAHYNVSDVLLVPNEPPMIRHDGALIKLPNVSPLPSDECKRTIYSMLNDRQKEAFERDGELDFSFAYKSMRFRVNVYSQQYGVAAALRTISPKIPKPEEIGLSPAILKLASLTRGLVLVTGPTGSGKTTTLYAMIEYINTRWKKHIITIEDPIEFVHENKNSIIDQREVGQHNSSFAQALKYTLRQNPDVILIGEMRDRETVDLAIRAAETGHLCISTLHTQDAPSTIDRIVSEFPADQRQKFCNVLANVLAGVVSQVLLPRADGGRVCAREVMVMNTGIATLLRDDKVHQIRGAIESGAYDGMQTLDQALVLLIQQKAITLEVGRTWARSPHSLDRMFESSQSEKTPPKK